MIVVSSVLPIEIRVFQLAIVMCSAIGVSSVIYQYHGVDNEAFRLHPIFTGCWRRNAKPYICLWFCEVILLRHFTSNMRKLLGIRWSIVSQCKDTFLGIFVRILQGITNYSILPFDILFLVSRFLFVRLLEYFINIVLQPLIREFVHQHGSILLVLL